jgi:NAD(P)-dependent dehydrogenase (short-subunit alcohol dehydrogenase family)
MENGGNRRIVNVASVAGKEGNPNASAYSASKAAVIALTKSLGKETAATNIRVNCITPAAIKTPLFDQMTAQHIEFMLSKIPLGRFGTIEEAMSLVCWLASEECSFSTEAYSTSRAGERLSSRAFRHIRVANSSREFVSPSPSTFAYPKFGCQPKLSSASV